MFINNFVQKPGYQDEGAPETSWRQGVRRRLPQEDRQEEEQDIRYMHWFMLYQIRL